MSDQMDLNAELSQLQGAYQEDSAAKKKTQLDAIKDQLRGEAQALAEVESDIADIERQLKVANGHANEILEKIRKLWGPFIDGTEYAELDLGGGLGLKSDTKTGVKVEDEDIMVKWLMDHGYKDVFKFQIHAQTRNSIVTKLFKDGEVVPGTAVTKFNVIKLK